MPAARKKATTRFVIPSFIVGLLVLAALYKTFAPNTGTFTQGEFIYIHTGAGYAQMKQGLESGGFIADMWSFEILSRFVGLPDHVHPGKYHIAPGMSNFSIIRMLHAGRQTQVSLVINKLHTKNDFITLVGNNLEADSNAMRALLDDPVLLAGFGLDTNTALCAILPNTYFFKWNTSADKAFKKIADNYVKFWTDSRKQQAREKGLNPAKATIVASIVDEETNIGADKPKIASVYLNRLQKGMKLQADPTVRYALGDFTIKRVTGPMLQNASPYNTYQHDGLPPGPICTPSAGTIDAVLQAPQTNFLYFCAKEDFSGYSNFAATYDDQLKNARAYQKALDARGIH